MSNINVLAETTTIIRKEYDRLVRAEALLKLVIGVNKTMKYIPDAVLAEVEAMVNETEKEEEVF